MSFLTACEKLPAAARLLIDEYFFSFSDDSAGASVATRAKSPPFWYRPRPGLSTQHSALSTELRAILHAYGSHRCRTAHGNESDGLPTPGQSETYGPPPRLARRKNHLPRRLSLR